MPTKAISLSAITLAIIIVLGFIPGIPIGILPVPIVIQNLGIMLAGVILGRRYGFYTVVIFLLMIAVGLPVLTGGQGGFAHLIGPTAGYLYSYAIAAFFIGWVTEHLRVKGQLNFVTLLFTIVIFGILLINVGGAIGLIIQTHMSVKTALVGQIAFIPGDIIKAILATIIGLVLARQKLLL